MNMISTGAFLPETDASTKQNELVKKLTAAWEKKNSKTARAGGASLMALSLAACGGEDNTPFSAADVSAAETAAAAAATTAALTGADGTVYASVDAAVTSNDTAIADAARAEGVASVDITSDNTEVMMSQADYDAAIAAADDDVQASLDSLQTTYDALQATYDALKADYDSVVAPKADALEVVGAEVLTGGVGDDNFSGTSKYDDAADVVSDNTTTDNDTLTMTLTAAMPQMTVQNIENVDVNLSLTAAAATDVDATKFSGVKNLTVSMDDVVIGGSSIKGNKDADITGVNAAKIDKVTSGTAETFDVTQVTKAGVTIDADTVSGNTTTGFADKDIVVIGATDISAMGLGTGDTIQVRTLNNATEDAKAVSVTTSAENVHIDDNTTSFTGSITVEATAAKAVLIDAAAGGATVNALGNKGTSGTDGITISGIDDTGVTVTTSYVGTKSSALDSSGEISLTGGSGTADVVTVAAAGAQDLSVSNIETLNLSGNGAAVNYNISNGGSIDKITVTGASEVTLTGDESVFDGNTVTGATLVDINAIATAAAMDLDSVGATLVDIGADNAGNAITVKNGGTYKVSVDQTTELEILAKADKDSITLQTGDDTTNDAQATMSVGALKLGNGTNDFTTVDIVANEGRLTATSIQAADTVINISGDENVDLGDTNNAFGSINATGLAANLTVELEDDATTVTGGSKVDTLTTKAGTTANLTIETGAGEDVVTLTAHGAGTSVGTGDDADTINLQAVTSAVVVAGAGNDTINIGTNGAEIDSDAIIVGGDGSDTLQINVTNGAVDLSNNSNFAFTSIETLEITSTNTLTIASADLAANNSGTLSVKGTTAALTVKGAASSANTIDTSGVTVASGSSATVTLTGGTKADSMTGGKANEIFIGDQGVDTIDGGTGTDAVSLTGVTIGTDKDSTETGAEAITGFVVNMGASSVSGATVLGVTGKYLSSDVSSVDSGQIAYNFTSDKAANSDVVDTFSNIDNITGSSGVDYIIGDVNANTIDGGAGTDFIVGGSGDDTIKLGSGDAVQDEVIFEATAALNGTDTVTNFVAGTDKINVGAFETVGTLVNLSGATDAWAAGEVFYLFGAAAGAADSAAGAISAINGAATLTDTAATAWVVISDNNSSAVYEVTGDGAANEATGDTFTLVATLDVALAAAGDILIA